MDRKLFFAELRKSLGSFSTLQVEGIEAILDGGKHLPISHMAYVLASAWHETGTKMQPVTENLNYSVEGLLKTFGRHRITEAQARRYGRTNNQPANQEAIANIIYGGEWGLKNLGNTKPGDGWRYRGRGLPQITGRSNYTKFGIADTPEKAGEMKTAVRLLIDGSVNGTYTGKRLSDFLPGDYVGARAVINADVKKNGPLVAGYARKFENALRAGGWNAIQPKVPQPIETTKAPQGWSALLASILNLFKRTT
ncbi:hypothetical protein [Aquamicrobium zhengzhouense]|uniref:hypothetical protein n=1 Tax=Aquamicrobium zhengzhouense TaxID=2781738 RepID=UPI0018E0CF49|nr:hypothetical protein [Aquamicrobium zhengzhouense]